jgi:DNA-binding PadR family transcriptional regulator
MPASESLGSLEQLILTAVDALKDKAYGAQVYDLACEFAGRELNAGSIYVTLERLYKKGYLVAVDAKEVPDRGRQPTKIYKLTPEGNAALLNSTRTQRRMHRSYFSRRRREWHLIQKEELQEEKGTA